MFAGRLDRQAFAVDFGNRMVQWHDWDSEFGNKLEVKKQVRNLP
jgi:hypothetical protein